MRACVYMQTPREHIHHEKRKHTRLASYSGRLFIRKGQPRIFVSIRTCSGGFTDYISQQTEKSDDKSCREAGNAQIRLSKKRPTRGFRDEGPIALLI